MRRGLFGIGMVLLLGGGAAVAADSLADQQRALLRARTQAAEARARSERLEARSAEAAAVADQARRQAAAMAARVQEAEAELRAATARVAIVDAIRRDQARRLAAKRAPVARLTAGLQLMARQPPALALMRPGRVADAVHLRIVLAGILPEIDRRTAGLRAELDRSRALKADAELARTALARSRERLAGRRSALARLEAEQRIASRRYRDGAAIEEERALAIGEDARDLIDLMDRMQVASVVRARLAVLPGPVLRPARPEEGTGAPPAASGLSPATPSASPAYRLPVVGDIVTGFGELAPSGVRSRGITLATEPGATIVAPAPGHVAFAGPFRDYGQIVIIDHGGGWTSLVTHMRRLSVGVGESVEQGDPIGATEMSRPRVTVELRRQDRPVDIAALLR